MVVAWCTNDGEMGHNYPSRLCSDRCLYLCMRNWCLSNTMHILFLIQDCIYYVAGSMYKLQFFSLAEKVYGALKCCICKNFCWDSQQVDLPAHLTMFPEYVTQILHLQLQNLQPSTIPCIPNSIPSWLL